MSMPTPSIPTNAPRMRAATITMSTITMTIQIASPMMGALTPRATRHGSARP